MEKFLEDQIQQQPSDLACGFFFFFFLIKIFFPCLIITCFSLIQLFVPCQEEYMFNDLFLTKLAITPLSKHKKKRKEKKEKKRFDPSIG